MGGVLGDLTDQVAPRGLRPAGRRLWTSGARLPARLPTPHQRLVELHDLRRPAHPDARGRTALAGRTRRRRRQPSASRQTWRRTPQAAADQVGVAEEHHQADVAGRQEAVDQAAVTDRPTGCC